MTPPAKRDELVTVLLERLDRFESSLSAVQQSLARFEVAEQQAHASIAQVHARADRLETRLAALEALSNRAEGAKGLGKALWVAIAAIGAAVVTWFARAAR